MRAPRSLCFELPSSSQNNLFTAAPRPPDLLVNVMIRPPGHCPVIGEVQVHLLDILHLKEVRRPSAVKRGVVRRFIVTLRRR